MAMLLEPIVKGFGLLVMCPMEDFAKRKDNKKPASQNNCGKCVAACIAGSLAGPSLQQVPGMPYQRKYSCQLAIIATRWSCTGSFPCFQFDIYSNLPRCLGMMLSRSIQDRLQEARRITDVSGWGGGCRDRFEEAMFRFEVGKQYGPESNIGICLGQKPMVEALQACHHLCRLRPLARPEPGTERRQGF